MSVPEITRHELAPCFELEEYMALCRETRLDGALLERLIRLWEKWLPKLNACVIKNGGAGVLAVWLPEEAEMEVDQLFEEAPAQGFMINNLAQYLCMAAAAEMQPLLAQGVCAPSPLPDKALADALAEAGLPCRMGDSFLPERRYALLTWHPFRGGCEVCAMQDNCPKGENFSMTLPGHEKADSDC